RFGLQIRQEATESVTQGTDGALAFTWSVQLSQMPLKGRARWSPSRAGVLVVEAAGAAPKEVPVPSGALLWPGDEDAALRRAVKDRAPLRYASYSFPTAEWAVRELKPEGPSPLPGFPDAVRFTGTDQQGGVSAPLELWASPTAGELKEHSQLAGLDLWMQRAELPPPGGPDQPSLFDQSVQTLPPDPFQPWRRELTVRYQGGTAPDLPDTPEQGKVGPGTWKLSQASAPTVEEAAQPPVQGPPSPEDRPYLAPTPLLQFKDPAFGGLVARMGLRPGLSRWALAQAVTDFVYRFIRQKDYSVGFASALEVCRDPKGDCTEHGVLAVALLRRLGVPARGVMGWVGLGQTLGMHFWVEVKLQDRWIPVDPTLDQVPASAFHLALGATNLADLGSLGWDRMVTALGGGTFVPVDAQPPACSGATVTAPDGSRLTWPGGAWRMQDGLLWLAAPDGTSHEAEARTPPTPAELEGARSLRGAQGRTGWWVPASRLLYLDLGARRWLQLTDCTEAQAFDALDELEVRPGR
ncbi:MAG TPA: transglutaminase domain-containing protein, partial [Holophagaceae bacterium]|nr:transglutaminase domain-containing protein [Holophagaceae bacterium]